MKFNIKNKKARTLSKDICVINLQKLPKSRKILTIIFIVLLIAIIFLAVSSLNVNIQSNEEIIQPKISGGATWTVDDDGSAEFNTIQDAVDEASPGDTIIVHPGTYIENVIVDKTLTIESVNGAETTIVQPPNQDNHVFEIAADYVTVSGFTIEGAPGYSGTAQTAIIVDRFGVGGQAGIYLNISDHATICNNVFLNSDLGILSRYSSYTNIRDNNIFGEGMFQGDGIFLISSKDNTIQDNYYEGFWYGIWFWNISDSIIQDNIFESTWIGIYLMNSSANLIQGNAFDFIHLAGSSNNVIKGNTITNTDYGIRLFGSSYNVIYLNNFVDNDQNSHSSDSTNTWHSPGQMIYTYKDNDHWYTFTSYLGSYWSDYSGIDDDGDGIGDTPYSINGDNDNYPLMKPFENYLSLPETEITESPSGIIYYNDVTFTWTGSDDITPTSELVYSFYLEGYDSEWSEWMPVTYTFFNDLPNGDYTFKVKAKDTANNIDPTAAEISFRIETPVSELWSYTTGDKVTSSPALGDVDGDGKLEVVFGSYDNKVYALNGEDGNVVWSYTTGDKVMSSPALGDVDGDGKLEVVFGSNDNKVYALNGEDGSIAWSYTTGSNVGTPALGDVDGDGNLEVVVGSDDTKVYALNGEDGSVLWSYTTEFYVRSSPALGDVDGDGKLEVVVGSYDAKMYALNGEDGSVAWSYETESFVMSPTLGDIDSDGKLEVVFGSCDNKVYALNGEDGSVAWSYTTESSIHICPALGDVDGDGKLEVVVGNGNFMMYVLNSEDGTVVWSCRMNYYVYSSPALGDVDGDGKLELVIGNSDGGIYALNGEDGSIDWSYMTGGWLGVCSSPALGDMDGDGKLEVVVGSNDNKVYCLKPTHSGERVSWQGLSGDSRFYRTKNTFEIGPPNLPNLIISSEPIEFYDLIPPPFLPNIINISTKVTNKGEGSAENVIVKAFIGDPDNGGIEIGASVEPKLLEPDDTKTFVLICEFPSNVENEKIYLRATSIGQDDLDLSDNTISHDINFYFVDFRHDKDVFSFENWGYSSWNEFREDMRYFLLMQGLEGDLITVLLSPIIYALNDYLLLRGKEIGHCYGMAASSVKYYLWPGVKPKPIDKPTFRMTKEEVKADIIESQWEQILHFWQIIYQEIQDDKKYNAILEYNKIITEIKDHSNPVVVGLHGNNVGHAVVAYKILEISEDEKRVYVYENNFPYDDPTDDFYPEKKKERDYYITFRPLSNEVYYTLSGSERIYEFNRAYAIGPFQIGGIDELSAILEELLNTWFNELWGKARMVFSIHSPVDCLFTDKFDQRIGFIDGSFINEIPGAQMEQQFESDVFYLPLDYSYRLDMIGTDTGEVSIDIIVPTSESTAKLAHFEEIPFNLDTRATTLLSAADIDYKVVFDSGEVFIPESVGEIESSLLEYTIPVKIDFDPDTLNLKSKGKWVTAYIEMPLCHDYDATKINFGTIMLNDQIKAESKPIEIGDYDGNGIPDLMIKFSRQAVQAIIIEVGENVEITISGRLVDGTIFKGKDIIKVIDKGKGKLKGDIASKYLEGYYITSGYSVEWILILLLGFFGIGLIIIKERKIIF